MRKEEAHEALTPQMFGPLDSSSLITRSLSETQNLLSHRKPSESESTLGQKSQRSFNKIPLNLKLQEA